MFQCIQHRLQLILGNIHIAESQPSVPHFKRKRARLHHLDNQAQIILINRNPAVNIRIGRQIFLHIHQIGIKTAVFLKCGNMLLYLTELMSTNRLFVNLTAIFRHQP